METLSHSRSMLRAGRRLRGQLYRIANTRKLLSVQRKHFNAVRTEKEETTRERQHVIESTGERKRKGKKKERGTTEVIRGYKRKQGFPCNRLVTLQPDPALRAARFADYYSWLCQRFFPFLFSFVFLLVCCGFTSPSVF